MTLFHTTQLRVAKRDGVATLALDNPAHRNALNQAMVAEIVLAMDAIEADREIGAIVITGVGSAFCSGAELGDLSQADPEQLQRTYAGFLRVARSTLPTIAAVNGPAVGAGMNLALGCDLRLVARSGRFDSRFAQIGLHPGGGHTWLTRQVAGPQVAMAMVLFGDVLDGPAAVAHGLAYRCVDDEALADSAQDLAMRVARLPRELAIELKRTVRTMGTVIEHERAVGIELRPQLWTLQQPWFSERIGAPHRHVSAPAQE